MLLIFAVSLASARPALLRWVAQLPGAEEELSDPSLEPMPLDPGDLVTALGSPAGLGSDKAQEAARVLRSVLQKAGHSPSGQLPSLASAVVEKRLATRGLFLTLRDKGLLTKAEPLHGMICAQLEPIEQRRVLHRHHHYRRLLLLPRP